MDLSVEDLCGLLKRSRLVTSEQVHALYDRWVAEAKERAASTTAFVRWLVQNNFLTEYQSTLLAKGMVDDFFLGEYKILDRLGRGRMAGVYKAQASGGNLVAIKVLPPSRTKIPALMARFQREARLALTFSHVNVVRSLDIGETKGLHYLVMEMLDGETVDEVLQRRKRLPPVEAVAIIHQALLGLQHLHEHGVVHRDIKPSNLMLTPSRKAGEPDSTLGRTVKILDVGLARKAESKAETGAPGEKVDPTEVTQEGVLLGTPDYLSPEQARDPRTIDIRSDMYSLGCVLYHLMAGHTPFPDSNILNLMIRHATETPRPVRAFLPSAPESLESLVATLIAKQADRRYPTPAHAAAAAQAVLDELKAAKPDEKPKRVPTAKALRKSGKFAALAKTAPVSKPHLPPPPPVEIELVPFEMPAPPPQSVFATDALDDAHALDDAVIVRRRNRPQKNWLYVSVSVGAIALVAVVGAVLTLMLRNHR